MSRTSSEMKVLTVVSPNSSAALVNALLSFLLVKVASPKDNIWHVPQFLEHSFF